MGDRRHRRMAAGCCPACAASLPAGRRAARRRGRRPARHAHPPWAWLAVLAGVAGLIPLAAREGGDRGVAHAAPPPMTAGTDAGAGGGRPAATAAPAKAAEEAPVRVAWRRSAALGAPNAGRLAGGVRLPARGPGFYTYDPATQAPPGGADRRWGTAHAVREVIALGRWWSRAHPGAPRLGIGDLSRPGGGAFHGPVVGHVSHQNGRDVDIRLPRRDGLEGRASPATYDRALTQRLVDRLVGRGAELVLIGPGLDLSGPPGVVMRWRNHDDHLHVRFPDPDGPGN